MSCKQDQCCQPKECKDGKCRPGEECGQTADCEQVLKNLPEPTTLALLIAGLHSIFSCGSISVEFVQRYMGKYKSNPEEWGKYAMWDDQKYTRNLVDKGNGKFNLLVLCWNKGQRSTIHSHANSHCFMKILDGEVKEELFEWPEDKAKETEMKFRSDGVHKKESVAYICDEMGLHRVGNPSQTEKAVTLHLYSPPFSECDCFDEKTSCSHTGQMTFWSEYGKKK